MPFHNRSFTITIVQWLKHAKYSYKEGKGSIKKMGRVQQFYFLVEFSVEDLIHTLMFSEWTKQPPFLLLCKLTHSKSWLFCPKITVIVRKVWICCKWFRGRFDRFSDSASLSISVSNFLFREGVINTQRGGVYEIGALRAPDADPPHFRLIPSVLPPKFNDSVRTPPKSTLWENFFKGKFCEPTPKTQNISKFSL